jgi:nucleotide-binding universal stress UspA family protein
VLVVPPGTDRLSASRVVVAWKNTLQSRRAISDAMPLLKLADQVQVIQVTDTANRAELDDVVAHLALHDVNATGIQRAADRAGTAAAIMEVAKEAGADLIVSGAFGYSRLREWFFGGVTRNLLEHAKVCCLMSH